MFFEPLFLKWTNRLQFWQLRQKNTTNSFMIFCSRFEVKYKKFGFFYLKAKLSYNILLVTWNAILAGIPMCFHWRQKLLGSTSKDIYAFNYIFKSVARKDPPDTQGAVNTNMPNCFLEAKFCGSNSKNNTEIILFFKKKVFFPRFMPLHTQNAILTTLIKNRQKFKYLLLKLWS